MPQIVVRNFKSKMGWLYNREFSISSHIDLAKLEEIGVMARLNPYLTKILLGMGSFSHAMGGGIYLSLANLCLRNYVLSFSLRSHLKTP